MTGGLALTLLAALGTALVLGAIAHRLGLPAIIGYIAAGLVVGPFTPGIIANPEEVQQFAEIGVALLMFSIGLRFRLAELLEFGRTVLIGAPLQVLITIALGVGVGGLIGSTFVESLFLGAVASVASTVVLVKVAGETSLQTSLHGRIALSWTIVQDLATVVLVVILTAVATPSEEPLRDGIVSTLVAMGFVAAVLLLGSRLLPALLGRVALLGSRELFVVAVAVIAIGTAAAAGLVGVSVALGAFVAGLALAESDLAASVLGEVVPLRELFATIFFVSVGILLQPAAVLAGWPVVLILLLLIMAGKAVPIAAILRAGGHRLGLALRAGGLLAQSGEFSFVLAAVGLQAGALDGVTFSQAMGAVVLSIVAAGPVAAGAARAGDWLDARRPAPVPDDIMHGAADDLHRHAVVVGFGHVGRTVGRVLDARRIPWLAIDLDYPLVRRAQHSSTRIIFGDAATPSVLDAARLDQASTMVITMADALAARQVVRYALSRNARLHIVARADSAAEEIELGRLGVARVITAERELGHELLRHTLARYGVSEREIDVILRRRE